MSNSFNCPNCGQKLSAKPELAGQIISCPACGSKIQVPAFEAPVPVAQQLSSPPPSAIPQRFRNPYEQMMCEPRQSSLQQLCRPTISNIPKRKQGSGTKTAVVTFSVILGMLIAAGAGFALMKQKVPLGQSKSAKRISTSRTLKVCCALAGSNGYGVPISFSVSLVGDNRDENGYGRQLETTFSSWKESLRNVEEKAKAYARAKDDFDTSSRIASMGGGLSLEAYHKSQTAIGELSKAKLAALNLGSAFKMQMGLSKTLAAFVRTKEAHGSCVFENVPPGEYTLVAFSHPPGLGGKTLYWVRHLKSEGSMCEVKLTNDGTCLIE